MENKKIFTINEIIIETNKLTGEIEKYRTARVALNNIPFLQRRLGLKKNKVSKLREEIKVYIDSIPKLWDQYKEIEIPNHLPEKHQKILHSARDYFETTNRNIKIYEEILVYSEYSFFGQFKRIKKIIQLFDQMGSSDKEWQMKAKHFFDSREDLP